MKKLLVLVTVLAMVLALTACGDKKNNTTPATEAPTATTAPTPTEAEATPTPEATPTEAPVSNVMSHADYVAASVDDPVIIEAYVMDTQSWWNDKITIYAADKDGAYFIYEAACSKEDSELLTPGKKIHVEGFKSEWFGEVEITDAKITFPEVTVPENWVGRTVGNIDIRKKYGISILAIKRDGRMSLFITPDTQLDEDMTLLVLGDQKAIQKCFRI